MYLWLNATHTPNHFTAPHRTAPHRPHRTAPHRTAPHRTAPHRTAPHRRSTQTRSIAKRVLAQTIAASVAERNWSVYGQIMDQGRCGLRHDRADKAVYCHEALHLQEKLQHAHSAPSVVRWDQSSDEATDEEDLKV